MKVIRKYEYSKDYNNILSCIIKENWQSFFEERKEEYKQALENSYTYVLYDNDEFCGYVRGISDQLFTLFIPEIIIREDKRHKGYGRVLIDYLHSTLPSTRIDLISDADEFYQKQGFHFVGNGMRKHNWY